jgi:transcriptional regulator with XRE-family HTH domain
VNEAHAIGDRLREARKRRGLTQRELARLSGLSVSLVRKLEQGDYGDVRQRPFTASLWCCGYPTSALAGGDAPVPDQQTVARWEPVRRDYSAIEPVWREDGDALPGEYLT